MPEADVAAVIDHERAISPSLDGHMVGPPSANKSARARNPSVQLSMFPGL